MPRAADPYRFFGLMYLSGQEGDPERLAVEDKVEQIKRISTANKHLSPQARVSQVRNKVNQSRSMVKEARRGRD